MDSNSLLSPTPGVGGGGRLPPVWPIGDMPLDRVWFFSSLSLRTVPPNTDVFLQRL